MSRFWTRHRRRKATFLARAAVSAAMGAGLIAIAFGLPNGPWEYSEAGCLLKGRWRGSVRRSYPQPVAIVERDGRFITANLDQFCDPANPLRLTTQESDGALASYMGIQGRRTGIWAVTTRHEVLAIYFATPDFEHIEAPPPAARLAVLDWYANNGWAVAAARLANGDIDRHVPIWRGYALNAASLALLIGSILVMPRRGWSVLRSSPPAGICDTCGYDLRGLPTPTCPECGVKEVDAPDGRESSFSMPRPHPPAPSESARTAASTPAPSA